MADIMRRAVAIALLAALLCAGALAETARVDCADANSRLNMRVEPSRESASLGGFYSGTQVEIICDAGAGWSAVTIGEGIASVSGYMKSDYLATGSDADAVLDGTYDALVASPYGTQSVVLRSRPSDSFEALAVLEVGDSVRVIGVSGDFYYVRMDDDSVGCLAGDELN